MCDIAVIILAAGASRRMGRPKQLLPFRGKYLLQHIVDEAFGFSDRVVVVLGANHEEISASINTEQVNVVFNNQWEQGMSTSVHCGLSALKNTNTETAIFLTCDQPFVTAGLLRQMTDVHQKNGQPIVACRYAETLGVPVLFHQSMFVQLNGLQGDAGAKKIVMQFPDLVATVDFPEGAFDIDTPDDYQNLIKA